MIGLTVNLVFAIQLIIFWTDACDTQYEFIVVNNQFTIFAFYKVV